MRKLKTLAGAAAALAALALGGSAIATAGQSATSAAKKHAKHHAKKHAASEKTTGPDTDSIQSGDQTSPDVRGKKSSASLAETGTPETSSETTSESESATPSDGPGGHEDPPGEVETVE
jgi:hypothetical protein